MDSNTFAIIVLGLGTVIVSIIIWQTLATVRSRASSTQGHELAALDARLAALADDVQAVEQRVTRLERPS